MHCTEYCGQGLSRIDCSVLLALGPWSRQISMRLPPRFAQRAGWILMGFMESAIEAQDQDSSVLLNGVGVLLVDPCRDIYIYI